MMWTILALAPPHPSYPVVFLHFRLSMSLLNLGTPTYWLFLSQFLLEISTMAEGNFTTPGPKQLT